MPIYRKLRLKYPIKDILNMTHNELEKRLKYTIPKSQIIEEGDKYPPFEGWETKYYDEPDIDAIFSKFLVLNDAIPKQPNPRYWYIRENGDHKNDWWYPVVNVQEISKLFENQDLLSDINQLISELLVSKSRISYLKQVLLPDAPRGYSELVTERYGRPVEPEQARKDREYLRMTRFPKRDEKGLVYRESKIRKPRAEKLDELGELENRVENVLPSQINSMFKKLVMVKKPEKPGKDDSFADHYYGYFGSKINFGALNKKNMPKAKSSKKGGKSTNKRGRQTKRAEVREADIRRLKKYGVPAALLATLAGVHKTNPQIEREIRKYLSGKTKKLPASVLRKLEKDVREDGREVPDYLKEKSDFGNVLAPAHRYPANNVVAMNDPFSRIYTYDAPHTWGQAHDMATNLSGFPWYKGQEPTLAIAPRNSRSGFGAKKLTKKQVALLTGAGVVGAVGQKAVEKASNKYIKKRNRIKELEKDIDRARQTLSRSPSESFETNRQGDRRGRCDSGLFYYYHGLPWSPRDSDDAFYIRDPEAESKSLYNKFFNRRRYRHAKNCMEQYEWDRNAARIMLRESSEKLKQLKGTGSIAFGAKRKRKTTKKRKTVNKNWVQKAIKNPGSLTAYAKKVAPRRAFTKRGTLKVAWLREVAKTDKSMKRRRQAQLALRLKKMPKRGRKVVKKVKRKTTKKPKRKTVKRKRKTVRKVKRKVVKKKSLKPRKRKSKFGGRFNYTIQQYGNNAGTPNLNQMHKISGVAAYDFPVAGPSAGGMNLRWFDSKTNQAGMGMW